MSHRTCLLVLPFLLTSGEEAAVSLNRSGLAAAAPATVIVPIVLDVQTASAHYTTRLSLTNAAPTAQSVTLTYTPSLGTREGGGSRSLSFGPLEQKVLANAISSLRELGLAIPDAAPNSPQGGTLAVTYDGSAGAVFALARTTTPTAAPQPLGEAGLAYGAIRAEDAFTSRAVVYGLRSNADERSNLAVFNAGAEPVTVSVTAFSGAGDRARFTVSGGVTLGPYAWTQWNGVLASVGLVNGWVVIERRSPSGRFGAYGVVNDNVTNDGSYLAAAAGDPSGVALALPVLVETTAYKTDLVLANSGLDAATMGLYYAESLSPAAGAGGLVNVTLNPGEQRLVPNAVDFLRRSGAAIGPPGKGDYAGAVRVAVRGVQLTEVSVMARTTGASSTGGRFGLAYPAIDSSRYATTQAMLYGLESGPTDRTNVAVVHAGDDGSGAIGLRLEALDESGAVRSSTTVTLSPGRWSQPPGFFSGSGLLRGSVRVTRVEGSAPLLAYAVVNDGAAPGRRTGDGSYVPMQRAPAWTTLASVHEARQEVTVAELDGRIYLLGGIGNNVVSSSVEVYDFETNRWSFAAPLPEPLHHPSSVAVGGALYVIGGYTNLSFAPTDSVYVYLPGADRWSPIARLPSRRGALASVAIDGKIYTVGGAGAGATGELDVYDPETNRWTPLAPMPTPREHVAAGVVDGKLYVAGGRNAQSFVLRTLEEYDRETNTWRSRAPMPTGRSGIAGAVAGGRFYVLGGEGNASSPKGTFAENESYDPATDTWRSELPMLTPRHGIGAAVSGRRIGIPAGGPVAGFSRTDVFEVFVVP